MAVKLPDVFVERMKRQLGEQFSAFLASYEQPRHYGLRFNPLKVKVDSFAAETPFQLRPVTWAEHAYYYNEPDRPGRHPYYHAGLYYIQEPSAMAPGELLGVEPGDKVLDLCAAPGGKSTQLAGKLQGRGLLVSNDQSAERTKALVKNLELFGVRNSLVLNESPHRMSRRFAGFFDKILVDAPCSGEGMFRKDENMWREWSEQSIVKCTAMQRDILRHAALMLVPGGRLVYSTCTFAVEENERMMLEFLAEHDDFELLDVKRSSGFATGQTFGLEATDEQRQFVARTVRLWPHLLDGEGHFVALLGKRGERGIDRVTKDGDLRQRAPRPNVRVALNLQDLHQFLREQTTLDWHGERFVTYGDHVYRLSAETPDLDGLKVVRPGQYVGVLKKNRLEPSHALALAMRVDDAQCSLSLSLEDERLQRYLRGETLDVPFEHLQFAEGYSGAATDKRYVLVCLGPYPLGWGKWQQGILKNEYPQTWRRLS